MERKHIKMIYENQEVFLEMYYCGDNIQIFHSAKKDDTKKYINLSKILMNLIIESILEKRIQGKPEKLYCFIDTHKR